jgi:hypothetical protein
MREMLCFAATGQLGYGIPRPAFERGINARPHYIGGDMGSIDPGPHSLGSGKPGKSYLGIKRDLEMILTAGRQLKIPVLLGSAGTAGGDPQVAEYVKIVEEISREKNLQFKMAVIHAEVSKEFVRQNLLAGNVVPCGPAPELTDHDLEQTVRIVGQMGVEPFIEALTKGADVILAGRACDASIFAALPIMHGFDKGLTFHMAKIIECTSLCSESGGRDAMMGYLRDDHFLVESQNPEKRCTPVSVAGHSLYEQPDPYVFYEPGGMVDMQAATYEQYDDRRTKVSGSRWIPAREYTIKLEGAAKVGYRAFSMGGVRDPIMISQINDICRDIKDLVRQVLSKEISPDRYNLNIRVYGQNGVMGVLEPNQKTDSYELFLLIDAVAETEELAIAICGVAKQNMLHCNYPGILATSGNLAIPFPPDVIPGGEVYRFSVHHLVTVTDPLALFPIEYIDFN